jgi:hypothetical protein
VTAATAKVDDETGATLGHSRRCGATCDFTPHLIVVAVAKLQLQDNGMRKARLDVESDTTRVAGEVNAGGVLKDSSMHFFFTPKIKQSSGKRAISVKISRPISLFLSVVVVKNNVE